MAVKNGNKTKVIIFSHSSSLNGGAEQAILEFAKYLKKENIIPFFVLPRKGDMGAELKQAKIAYSTIESSWWLQQQEVNLQRDLADLNAIAELCALIREQEPDFCITNTSVNPWGALVAKIYGIPHAWFIHELVHPKSENRYYFTKREVMRDINSLSNLVVANSLETKKFIEPYIDKEKLAIAMPLLHRKKIEEFSRLDSKPVFKKDIKIKLLCVGRINDEKGQLDAIKAVAYLKNKAAASVQLVLAGDISDDYKSTLMKYIETNKLTHYITFLDYQENPFSLMGQADIVLNCSRLESLGRTSLEAMVLGKPVISADNIGSNEIIINNVSGYIYKPGDYESLSQKILKIIEKNNSEISSAALQRSSQLFEIAESQYKELVNFIKKFQRKRDIQLSSVKLLESKQNRISNNIRDLKEEINKLHEQIAFYSGKLKATSQQLSRLENELNAIYNSKSWQVAEKMSKTASIIRSVLQKRS